MTSGGVAGRGARVALVVLGLLGLLAIWRSGVLSALTAAATLATSIREVGVRGYLGFVLADALIQHRANFPETTRRMAVVRGQHHRCTASPDPRLTPSAVLNPLRVG